MSKGISETFQEQEQDTAKRGVPAELFERATRTAKMQKIDVDQLLRTESGTRPAVTATEIEEHARERRDDPAALEPEPEADPHSRPTMQAVAFHRTHVRTPLLEIVPTLPTTGTAEPSPAVVTPGLAVRPPTGDPAATTAPGGRPAKLQERLRHVVIARALLTAIIVGTMFLVAAAGAFGFALGRSTARHGSR